MKPIEPGELGILKLVFGRGPDGRYLIRHILPLRLSPAEGEPTDLFRLSDDLVHAQPAYLSTIIDTLRQSIVPVVAMVRGEDAMRCLGTGFLVSATGLLITAAHVITDPIDRNYGAVRHTEDRGWSSPDLRLGVMIGVGPDAWTFRPIDWAEFLSEPSEQPLPLRGRDLRLVSDVAICQVEAARGEIFQPLTVIQPGVRGTGLAVGKTATAIGYGAMQDSALQVERPDLISGDFNFELWVSTGTILEHLPDNPVNRRAMTPGPCFRAGLKLPGGMSGSPIFDNEGIYVHGVVSSGMEDQSGLALQGHGSMLAASMHIPITSLDGKTMLELLKARSHGMPTFSMPDA